MVSAKSTWLQAYKSIKDIGTLEELERAFHHGVWPSVPHYDPEDLVGDEPQYVPISEEELERKSKKTSKKGINNILDDDISFNYVTLRM